MVIPLALMEQVNVIASLGSPVKPALNVLKVMQEKDAKANVPMPPIQLGELVIVSILKSIFEMFSKSFSF